MQVYLRHHPVYQKRPRNEIPCHLPPFPTSLLGLRGILKSANLYEEAFNVTLCRFLVDDYFNDESHWIMHNRPVRIIFKHVRWLDQLRNGYFVLLDEEMHHYLDLLGQLEAHERIEDERYVQEMVQIQSQRGVHMDSDGANTTSSTSSSSTGTGYVRHRRVRLGWMSHVVGGRYDENSSGVWDEDRHDQSRMKGVGKERLTVDLLRRIADKVNLYMGTGLGAGVDVRENNIIAMIAAVTSRASGPPPYPRPVSSSASGASQSSEGPHSTTSSSTRYGWNADGTDSFLMTLLYTIFSWVRLISRSLFSWLPWFQWNLPVSNFNMKGAQYGLRHAGNREAQELQLKLHCSVGKMVLLARDIGKTERVLQLLTSASETLLMRHSYYVRPENSLKPFYEQSIDRTPWAHTPNYNDYIHKMDQLDPLPLYYNRANWISFRTHSLVPLTTVANSFEAASALMLNRYVYLGGPFATRVAEESVYYIFMTVSRLMSIQLVPLVQQIREGWLKTGENPPQPSAAQEMEYVEEDIEYRTKHDTQTKGGSVNSTFLGHPYVRCKTPDYFPEDAKGGRVDDGNGKQLSEDLRYVYACLRLFVDKHVNRCDSMVYKSLGCLAWSMRCVLVQTERDQRRLVTKMKANLMQWVSKSLPGYAFEEAIEEYDSQLANDQAEVNKEQMNRRAGYGESDELLRSRRDMAKKKESVPVNDDETVVMTNLINRLVDTVRERQMKQRVYHHQNNEEELEDEDAGRVGTEFEDEDEVEYINVPPFPGESTVKKTDTDAEPPERIDTGSGHGEAATVAASARLLHSTRPMAASDMATHWNMEKLVTFGVIGLLPACAVASGTAPLLDTALGVAVVVHGHWGLECILTDYVHGQGPETVAKVGTYVFSAASLLAVSYFNMHDVGLVEAVKLLWTL
eukprot:Nk52_evm5s251 gene=Nk52_evmTU5s251